MPAETVQIDPVHTPADIQREAAAMLGAGPLRQLTPLTPGRLALLEIIESPFVCGTAQPTALDAVRALYILASGPGALLPALAAARQTAALIADSATDPDSPARLAALAQAQEGFADLDRAAVEWLDGSGIGSLSEAANLLADHFAASCAGLSLIQSGDAQKKTTGPSSPNGSPTSTMPPPPLHRPSILTRICGACRWLRPGTSAPPASVPSAPPPRAP